MSTASAAETTTLGMTDLEVSRIAFGTWQLGGDWGRFDETEAIKAAHAWEAGRARSMVARAWVRPAPPLPPSTSRV